MLLGKYYRVEDMDNMEAVIDKAELAVSSTLESDPDRGERLSGGKISKGLTRRTTRATSQAMRPRAIIPGTA